MAKKKKGQITVLEAVDTLSHLADLDIEKPEQVEWLDPARVEENQDSIRDTFRTINSYLQHMYQKDRQELSRPQTQKGIHSMMQLAGEAVDKVGQYTELFQGAHAQDETITEFKKLQQFYLAKVFSKVQKEAQGESWELEAEIQGDDEARQILKDLSIVRQDQDYELFYITHDDGTPFYTSNLLRHLRMVGNFDETFISVEREDLLSKLEASLDRDLHLSAQRLLQECSDLIDLFYKEALHHKENETIMQIANSIMALLLAANPKNLRHNSQGKCATDYWNDFVTYLRLGMETENYGKWRGESKLLELYQICLKLMHRMSHALFLRVGSRHEDMEFLYSIVGKTLDSSHSMWTSIAEAEKKVLQTLQSFPSGPLMKILKMFRFQQEKMGFDPLLQNNAAEQFFTLTTEDLHTTVIHTPTPIHQSTLEKGEINAEFKGYLHALGDRRHLYINLQDRTSWKEQLRCTLLEAISQKGEFSETLYLITLPKDTDFYHQIKHYGEMSDAKQFCSICVEQVLGGGECGFYFPGGKTPKSWIEPLVKFIHRQFFLGQGKLDRKQRLDFIEILYFFIILRYLDEEKPDVMNFSCKDGVDSGSAASASFYGFARMLSSKSPWTQNDRDCFLFALFVPALFVRHRSIDTRRIHRALSALE
ncbi:MAG: hypothetical protein ACRDFB_09090, partial [Rhabdochlamydiaceae bacterium]